MTCRRPRRLCRRGRRPHHPRCRPRRPRRPRRRPRCRPRRPRCRRPWRRPRRRPRSHRTYGNEADQVVVLVVLAEVHIEICAVPFSRLKEQSQITQSDRFGQVDTDRHQNGHGSDSIGAIPHEQGETALTDEARSSTTGPRTRDRDDRGYGLPLVTTDLESSAEDLVARYASRWGIEHRVGTARCLPARGARPALLQPWQGQIGGECAAAAEQRPPVPVRSPERASL